MTRLLTVFLLASTAVGLEVTPLLKVVQLLGDLLEKGKKAKHDEEVAFAKFNEWCTNTQTEKKKRIAVGASQIDQSSSDIAAAKSDAEVLSQEVTDLNGEVSTASGELKSATALRAKEHADFQATRKDLSESSEACQAAIKVLKARGADVPQALLQLQDMPLVPSSAKDAVTSLLALRKNGQTPLPNAYEFQSGSVVDMLEKLTVRFKDERVALEKAELNSKANYERLAQQLTDNVKADEATISSKVQTRGGRLADASRATQDRASTSDVKADDEGTLADTVAQCDFNTDEYKKNQATRVEEIQAIESAIEILNGDAVKGHAGTYLPAAALLQKKITSFAQLRNGDSIDVRARAAAYLQSRAHKLDSHFLSVLAEHAREDPFGKVKQMIRDLLQRLTEQQNSEADENAFCQTELATNKLTRENKQTEAEQLKAKADELASAIAQLTSEVAELSDAIADLHSQQADASKLRADEKVTNAKTVADAKEAQEAVQQAIHVLRDFYGSSMIQRGAHTRSVKHQVTEPYAGLTGESTGVFGLLQVILSDFARLEFETSSAEEQNAAAHRRFMAESDQSIAVKTTSANHKDSARLRTQDNLRSVTKQLDRTHEELDAADSYNEKLKSDCVDHGLSYEERVQRREQEIQSLQEALRILGGSFGAL